MVNNKKTQHDVSQKLDNVPEYVFIGTNFHCHEPPGSIEKYTKEDSSKSFPDKVTLGFRNNFWGVFSKVTRHDLDDVTFTWLGRKWIFREMWTAESTDVDFAHYLEDPCNIFVLFIISPVDQDEFVSIRKLTLDSGLNEQAAIASLVENINNDGIFKYFRTAKHERKLNSLFTWLGNNITTEFIPAAAGLFFFYSFCLMMTWKISRDQTTIDLRIENKRFKRQMAVVLRLRAQIINVERFFFTKNISNDQKIKQLATSMKSRFGLKRKMEGFLALNESMEQLLSTASQLRTDDKISMLNIIAFAIAVVGLPTGIFSALLAINMDNPILKDGAHSVLSPEVMWLASIVFVASFTPLLLISTLYFFYSRFFK